MICDRAWKAFKKADLTLAVKVITATWACKKKTNGIYKGK